MELTVYRIEDETGLGIYRSPYGTFSLNGGNHQISRFSAKRPDPNRDLPKITEGEPGDYIFGCHGLKQLRAWFYDGILSAQELARMQNAGMMVLKYKVRRNHLVLGKKQCVFIREHARCIGQLDLVTLEEI